MKPIIFYKKEITVNETILKLDITEHYLTKLETGEMTANEIFALYKSGEVLDRKTVNTNIDIYKWENFKLKEKTVKSWYELLPLMIKEKVFEAVFIKKDKTERKIICKFEATNHLEKGVLTVFDIEKNDYRSINLETLKNVVIGNYIYTLQKEKLLFV